MAKLKSMFSKKYNKKYTGLDISVSSMYDYSTKESREKTAMYLLSYSQSLRSQTEKRWELMNDYYNGDHRTAIELKTMLESQGIPFQIACVQDPFLHVESQISPDIPTFEFNGRDDDIDSLRAKQREYAVQFVIDNCDVNGKNTRNERRLGKLGNAAWKVYWDSSIEVPGTMVGGDIRVDDIPIECIYPDPSALTTDDCEYMNYVYPMHIRKAARKYKDELKKLDITLSPSTILGVDNIFNSETQDNTTDNVEIFEHWYRDDEGDIACSIFINAIEIKHIEKYWLNTGIQNKSFPFVIYCKIQDENEFWDRAEIEPIIELVDAADRELAYGLLNTAMNGAGMIIMEEGTLADGASIQNRPFGITELKQGMSGSFQRVNGVSGLNAVADTITFLQNQMERTVGNFDTSMGQEPARVTTSSGIAQMNERADARKNIKKADRNTGFQRLFELVDWSCLEFYDEERMIFIGSSDKEMNKRYTKYTQGQEQMIENLDTEEGPIIFKYSSEKMAIKNERDELYFPKIDCMVQTSDSLVKSKAFSIQAIQDLIATNITPQNIELVKEYIDILGLPSRKMIKDSLDAALGVQKTEKGAPTPDDVIGQLTPEEQKTLEADPTLLNQAMQDMGGE